MADGKIISFISSGITYGLPVEVVGEMVPLKRLEPMPGVPGQVRGGLVIRDELIPVLDLRMLLGHQTLLAERRALVDALNQREQDHIAWVDDLTRSVKTGEEFRKTTDPTKCAFGQWYYSYVPQDSVIERLFKQFEEPHNAIHALGVTVLDTLRAGHQAEANEMVESAKRGALQQLLTLFREFKQSLIEDLREITIILRAPDGHTTGLAVETIQQIIDLSKAGTSTHTIDGQTALVTSALKVPQGVVYCLDPKAIFSTAQS